MRTVILVLIAAVGLWGLHRGLTYAEERGWVYYRKKRGSYGGLGVTSNFLNMYDPSRRHLQESCGGWNGNATRMMMEMAIHPPPHLRSAR